MNFYIYCELFTNKIHLKEFSVGTEIIMKSFWPDNKGQNKFTVHLYPEPAPENAVVSVPSKSVNHLSFPQFF